MAVKEKVQAKAAKKHEPDYKKALEKLNEQSKRGGDRNYIELEQGKNTVRVLPGHPDMEGFYEEIYYHNKQVGKKARTTVICLNHGNPDGEDCPICAELEELRASKDKDDRKAYGLLRPKARFFMNAVKRPEEECKILACGISIMKEILGFITDEDYGDILDPQEGTDLVITKTGEMLDTEYSVKARRNPSPVFEDEDAVNALIGTTAKNTKLTNLTEMKTQFEGEPKKVMLIWEEGWDALKDMEEDDEDEKPKKGKKGVKSKSKPEPEEDDEEDEEEEVPKAKAKKKAKPEPEEDEDEEEEEEPKPKAKKKAKPVVEEDEDEDEEEEEEEPKPKKKSKPEPEPVKAKAKKKPVEDDDDAEDLDDLDAVLNKHKAKGKK